MMYRGGVASLWLACSLVAALSWSASEAHDFARWSPTERGRFTPDWDSLDKRVAPTWYDDSKVGIFIHWGVFSVPSYISEWFWWYWQGSKTPEAVNFMKSNYPPGWTYADFARDFTAEFYNATQWAELFQDSGAKYIVLTTKHHEGFTLWPSSTSFNWNAMDVGPHRDLVGELEKAVKATKSVHFGLYHSLFEWFNPMWLEDKANNLTTDTYSRNKAQPELYDLINRYKPDILWSDGDAEGTDKYWNSTGFISWLYNDSPVKDSILVNDRWGVNTSCHHGDFYNCADRYNPGHTLPHKWENAFTLDKYSWGYRRTMNINDVLTIEELLSNIVSTVACNGNALINIGPRKDGTIPAIFQERLRQMGQWLKTNAEAIYSTRPWTSAKDRLNPSVWFTQNEQQKAVYAHITQWPQNGVLKLSDVNTTVPVSKVSMLGTNGAELNIDMDSASATISLPTATDAGQWVWVLKLQL